jgi:hypothetical protein
MITPFKIFRFITDKLHPVLFFRQKEDSFHQESEEGYRMFPISKFHLFTIKYKLLFLLIKTVWATLSLPVKVFAVTGCIAATSGSVILVNMISSQREIAETITSEQAPADKQHEAVADSYMTEDIPIPDEHDEVIHYYNNNLRTPDASNQMSPISIIRHDNIHLPETSDQSLRYSSFPEIFVGKYRFIDFRELYRYNKPILVPILGGLEARFENRQALSGQETFLMSDTLGYIQFLERLAANIQSGNFYEAERLLSLLSNQRPDDENAMFYKGYVHMLKREYTKAQGFFLKCEHSKFKAFYHEARYNRACVLYLKGSNDEALNLLKIIEKEHSPFVKEVSTLKFAIENITQP